eukprot:tig00001160_g7344.t1
MHARVRREAPSRRALLATGGTIVSVDSTYIFADKNKQVDSTGAVTVSMPASMPDVNYGAAAAGGSSTRRGRLLLQLAAQGVPLFPMNAGLGVALQLQLRLRPRGHL